MLESLNTSGSRFGDLWLASLRKANATTEPEKELLVHALEPLMIKTSLSTADLRKDHAAMYNIIGDPATRLFSPLKLEAGISIKEGVWHWNVPNPPAGASLYVQLLAPLPQFTLDKPAQGRAESLKNLTEANAKLRFQTVTRIPAGQPWSGTVPGPGTLRLVAVGDSALSVAASRMDEPEVPAQAQK